MQAFTINLAGRVKNFTLSKNNALMPLFEAIVNSINSIEERRQKDTSFGAGKIIINVIREDFRKLPGMEKENVEQRITGFEVIDNGIGFNDENFKSFMTSDSAYKAPKGGKGVGRFSWLKAFEQVVIESKYHENKVSYKRKFIFSLKEPNVDNDIKQISELEDNSTSVKLENYKPEYFKNAQNDCEVLSDKIIQHCLIFFFTDKNISVELNDNAHIVSLNDKFNEVFNVDENTVKFKIKGWDMKLLNVQIKDKNFSGNRLFVCADSRLVKDVDLNKLITNLDNEFYNVSKYYYLGVLSSPFLDNNVNLDRETFNIINSDEDNVFDEPSLEDIVKVTVIQIEKYLSEPLSVIDANKEKQIATFIKNSAPQFGILMKYSQNEVRKIKPNQSNEKIHDELSKIERYFNKKLKNENSKLLDDFKKNIIDDEKYKRKVDEQLEKITDSNKAALVEYVARRKVVIDILKEALKINDDNKYEKEKLIHKIIYPMRATSNDVPKEAHNLWLLDEKLSYCSFVASDKQMDKNNCEDRPDILLLNSPVAVSDSFNNGDEYKTIILFELKRPMRDDYTTADNPIDQLINYVQKIKKGKLLDGDGRPVRVGENTQFYLYAVCDITDTLQDIIDKGDYTRTPDGKGFYRYHTKYHAYIEVLSYDKIVDDAQQRNKVFFDKIGF